MDLYVFSITRDEGFGLALTEAMSARLPIVATDVGPCREVLADSGELVQPYDTGALASALHGLVTDAERRRQLGVAAAVRVRARFDVELATHRWLTAAGLAE